MKPLFSSAKEAVQAIEIYYEERHEALSGETRIPALFIRDKILGASNDEMYVLFNCSDPVLRLRTNLEEEASFHESLRLTLDDYADVASTKIFYRDAEEGIDYCPFFGRDGVLDSLGDSDASYDDCDPRHSQYKLECEAAFPRHPIHLTVMYKELCRFLYNTDFLGKKCTDALKTAASLSPDRMNEEGSQRRTGRGRQQDQEAWRDSCTAATKVLVELLTAEEATAKIDKSNFQKRCDEMLNMLIKDSNCKKKKYSENSPAKVRNSVITGVWAAIPENYKLTPHDILLQHAKKTIEKTNHK